MARTSRSKSADEDVSDEDRSAASKAYASVGISLYNDQGVYQDYTKTLDELAAVWDDLTDAQRNYIAEQSAGVRGVNVFNAMIKSWQESKVLAEDALSDTGFMYEVQEKYMDSMTGKLQTLEATLQEFWYSMLDTGVLNTFIDLLTTLVNIFSNAAEGVGTLMNLLSPFIDIIQSITSGINTFTNAISDLDGGLTSLIATLGLLYTSWTMFVNFKDGKALFEGFGDIFKSAELSSKSSKFKDFASAMLPSLSKEISEIEKESGKLFAEELSKAEIDFSHESGKTLEMSYELEDISDKMEDTANSADVLENSIEEIGESSQKSAGGLKGFFSSLSRGQKIFAGMLAAYVGLKIFDFMTVSSKETAQAVDELSKKFEENQQTLSSNRQTIDEIGEEFERLSQGVSPLGENVSLTTDEFKRYQEICNQIAQMYPDLVKSYDAQGNAILNLTGNLKELNAEYEKQRLNAAQENISNIGDYRANWNNVNGNRSFGTKLWDEASDGLFGLFGSNIGGSITSKEAVDELKKVQQMTYDEVKDYLTNTKWFDLDTDQAQLARWLENYLDFDNVLNEADWNNKIQEIPSLISVAGKDLDSAADDYRNTMQSYLDILTLDSSQYPEFADIDDNIISQVSTLISKTSTEQLQRLSEQGVSELEYVKDLLSTISSDKSYQDSLKNILSITPETDIQELKRILDEDLTNLDKALSYDDTNELKVKLGLEDADTLVSKYEETLGYVSRRLSNVEGLDFTFEDVFTTDVNRRSKSINSLLDQSGDLIKDIANNYDEVNQFIIDEQINTEEELDLLRQCVDETDSWKEAMDSFKLQNINLEVNAESLAALEANLETIEKAIKNYEDAIASSQSSYGLKREQISNIEAMFSQLDGYNYDKLFESTAEGVHLNVQELESLNKKYKEFESAKYDNKIKDLREQYSDLCVAIEETSGAERNNYIEQRDAIAEQIKQAQELQSMYEGMTNAVSEWQRARSGGEEGDTYLEISKGLEDLKKLYDQGLVGTREFKAGVQMMSNEDLTGASIEKYLEVYKSKYKEFNSWFNAENASGLETFLKKLNSINKAWANQNKDGSWNIDASIEEMADSLGVSQAAIEEIFKRLNDYGFDVDFTESTDHLITLRHEAEKAFKEIDDATKKKYNLSFNTKDIEDSKDKVKKAREELEKVEKAIEEVGKAGGDTKSLEEFASYLKGVIGETRTFDVKVNTKDALDKLKELENVLNKKLDIELEIDWTNGDPEYYKRQADELHQGLTSVTDANGKINLDGEELQAAIDMTLMLNRKQVECSNTVITIGVDTTGLDEGLAKGINDLEELTYLIEDYNKLKAEFKPGVSNEKLQEELASIQDQINAKIQSINKNAPSLLTKVGIDAEHFDAESSAAMAVLTATIKNYNPQVFIDLGVDDTKIKNYEAPEKKSTLKFDVNDKAVTDALNKVDEKVKKNRILTFIEQGLTSIENRLKNIKDQNVTVTTTYKQVGSPSVNSNSYGSRYVAVNGNANASGNTHPTLLQRGSAFVRGTWGTAKTGKSLVGELGKELIVRGQNFFTVGDNGAEMVDIKKGDIIFNHKQTEEILNNGKVTSNGGRGKMANANGNAYASGVQGNYNTGGSLPGSNKFYNNATKSSSSKKSNSSKKSSSKSNDFLETFDWVEVKIDRLERKIEELDTIASSAYKAFSTRNSKLSTEFSKVTEEIKLQQSAYDVYIKKANSIGLSSSYATKVRNGALKIEDIKDEKLAEKIKNYQEWYEKALDCKDAITELNEKLGDLAKQRFDNISDEYDYILGEIEHRINNVEKGLDIVEAKGNFAGKSYFQSLISTEKENMAMISKEYNALTTEFNNAMATGAIKKNSEAWYEMKQRINEVQEAYQEAQLALIEYKNEMREMDWSIFEKTQDYISQITDESNFLMELMSLNENDLFSKKSGKLNDYGNTVGGLHAVNYNVYMAQADEYRKKMEDINKELAEDPYNTILIDKKNEYIAAQRESILAANNEKKAVQDLISDSYERMLDILEELINKRKDALKAEKDLYDYEKNVKKQVKEITDLRKQLLALQGDTSEDAKSRRQQLQSSLTDAEADLKETEYEKWLDDQERLLDDLYNDYEMFLNERLDYIDQLMLDMIDYTNNNADMMNQTIQDVTTGANGVGYQITEGMQSIWNNPDNSVSKVVSDYNDNFTNTLTTTNSYIKDIKTLVQQIVGKSETEKTENTGGNVSTNGSKTSSSSSSSTSNKATSTTTSSKTTTSSTSNKTSSSSNKGSFFIKKKDNTAKSKLNINNSIVDRLKYRDFDSSFNARRKYYAGMGLGSAASYTGSAKQNTAMINWMNNCPSKTPLIAGTPPQP